MGKNRGWGGGGVGGWGGERGGDRDGWSCVKDKGMPTANGYVIYSFGFHCFQVWYKIRNNTHFFWSDVPWWESTPNNLLHPSPLPSRPPTHSRRGNPNTESRYIVSPRLLRATFRLQMTSSFWCLKRTKALKLIGNVIANLVHFSDTSKSDGFLLHLL